MLTKMFIANLFLSIEKNTSFQKDEFTVRHDSQCFKLSLIFNSTYFYELSKTYRGSEATYCPGRVLEMEKAGFENSPDDITKQVITWLKRVEDELLSDVSIKITNERIKEQQESIDQILTQIDEMSDEAFTKDEASLLYEKLENLEKNIAHELTKQQDENSELRQELLKIKNEVELLKNTIEGSNKKGWAKMFVLKAFRWSKKPENRELLSAGIEIAKTFLPDAANIIK